MRRVAVSLVALGLLVAWTVPATAAGPAAGTDSPGEAHAAKKKKKKKCKRKKCKKKPAAPVMPPATPFNPPPPPPPPPPQTTFEKIDAAVASGALTPEQGLTYKVFASFGDPRLPGQYAGLRDSLAHAPLDEVAGQWNQLSASAQATLGPFLIPPMHDGSYVNQQIDTAAGKSSAVAATPRADDPPNPTQPWCTGNNEINFDNWQFIDAIHGSAVGKVRIWIQNRYATTDGALADSLMAAMQNQIWPKLTTLMGREPLPDGGSTGSCGGGTDALDIALVDLYPASTVSTTTSQESTPARIMFPRSRDNSAPYLTHEFMHAIQFSFNLASGTLSSDENAWLKDGTAQWAMDYVSSPTYGINLTPNDTEKNYGALSYYFTRPDKPLDTATPTGRPYSAYLFWLWAVRKGNNTSLVRQVWDAATTQKSLEAAKSLFGSGWDQAWKDFTRTNWNKDGITDYQTWDSIVNVPAQERTINPLQNTVTPVITTVEPVAAKYWTFVPAAGVNELTYRNLGGVSDKAGVQAIIKFKDNTYGIDDWTQVVQRDVPMCDIAELTLVLSNSSVTENDTRAFNLSWSPVAPGPRKAAGRAGVCLPDPQGSFSGTAHYDDSATTIMDWSWSGNVEFDPFGPGNPWFPEFQTEVWDTATVVSGSVTMGGTGTVEGSDGTCTISVPAASYEIDASDGGYIMIQPGPEPHYGIQLNFPADQFPTGTVSCPDDDPFETFLPVPGTLVWTEEPQQAATRGTYQGSASFGNEFYDYNSSWNFSDPLD